MEGNREKKLIALPYYYHRDPRRTMRPSERLFMYLYGRCNTAEPKRFVYEWIRPRYHRPVIQKRRWQTRPRFAKQIIGEREWVRGGGVMRFLITPKTAPAESRRFLSSREIYRPFDGTGMDAPPGRGLGRLLIRLH